MEPWILDKIRRQKQAQQQKEGVQPRLPAPEPYWEEPPKENGEHDRSTSIDFEIKF